MVGGIAPGELLLEPMSDDIDTTVCEHIPFIGNKNPSAPFQTLDAVWEAVRRLNGEEVLDATKLLEPLLTDGQWLLGRSYQSEVQALVAIGYICKDDFHHAIALARHAADHREAARFHSILLTILRFGYWRTRNFEALYGLSRPRFSRASHISALSQIFNLSIEAAAEAEQLRFKLAERLAKDAVELSHQLMGPESNPSLLPICVLANLAYESDAIDEADLLLRGRMATIDHFLALDGALLGVSVTTKVALARGNVSLALLMLRKGEEIGIRRMWPRLVSYCASEEIAIHIRENRMDMALNALAKTEAWVESLSDHWAQRSIEASPLDVARYRIALELGQFDLAVQGFRRLRDSMVNRNHPLLMVKLTVLLAGSLFRAGQEDTAKDELLGALQLGAGAGLFRTFVDEMPLIDCCLREIRLSLTAGAAHLNPYVRGLLSAVGSPAVDRKKSNLNHALADVLSARETIILRLISLGMSNKIIARELHIAPETVKSHAKRIFIKLSTKTRAEAVARANEFGLI